MTDTKLENLSWPDVDIVGSRILVVDDNEQNVDLLEAYLLAAKYLPLKAYDGFEALEVTKEEKPDLILLDIMMPRMDGYEVLEKLKADPELSRIPVIIVTALEEKEDRLRGLEGGADEFLTKPVDKLELYARLKNLLRSKKLFDSLEEAYEGLEKLQNHKEGLIRLIIHDLKNPISGIMGNLQLMGMKIGKEGAEEKLNRYRSQAERSTKKLLHMIGDILDISRMEDARFPLNPSRVNLPSLVREVIDTLKSSADSQNKTLSYQGPEELTLTVDPEVTRRIISNLVSNGISHTSPGTEVEVEVEEGEENISIICRDNGPGIPKKYHKKIFDQYSQGELKEEGIKTGHGLGLTFCKLATESQGGRIYVASEREEGEGATIVVELPRSTSSGSS